MRRFILVLSAPQLYFNVTLAREADLAAIEKIKNEGRHHSQVMNIAFQITDVNGPRLTNSPGYFRAANWAKNELSNWGLKNVALEPRSQFGKGWELKKSYIAPKSVWLSINFKDHLN